MTVIFSNFSANGRTFSDSRSLAFVMVVLSALPVYLQEQATYKQCTALMVVNYLHCEPPQYVNEENI